MFSLIIGVVTVAMVTVILLATMYYGGSAFYAAGPKAKASQLTTEAEQLRTAIQMFLVDNGKLPSKLEDLTAEGKYLKNTPENWKSTSQFFTNESYQVEKDTCLIFNQQRGVPFVPECTDEVYRNVTVCCRNNLMSAD